MENNVIILIASIFVLLIINVFYLFHRIINQTKKAKNEFEGYLERKIELFLEIIKEAKKYSFLGKKLEEEIKKGIENIKSAKTIQDKKTLSGILSSIVDKIDNNSDRFKRLKYDFKEIEKGMESFKGLWFAVLMFLKNFKNNKKEEVVEEKRVKVKIKKK
jgi:hypothetical protein